MDGSGAQLSNLLDRFAAARCLGISVRKLDDMVRQRLIPSVKLGRRRLFDPARLQQWIRQQHEQAEAV